MTSCAKFWNEVDSKGGKIMDVWKLKKVIVQSTDLSDGWLFKDQKGNSLFVGGDVKTIRLIGENAKEMWDSYHEYHMEFESLSYREKFFK